MELVKIEAGAMGYYSGQTYSEQIFITKESYEKVKNEIDDMCIYIYDLDGKHSECECDIDVEDVDDNYFIYYKLIKNDGDDLYYQLLDIFTDKGLDLNEDMYKVNTFISSIDKWIDVKVQIKESQIDKLNEFLASLE